MDQSPQVIIHAHDRFVKEAMSHPQVAKDFFAAHLPPDILQVIDLNHLVLQNHSHIDEMRNESTVDILYKTTINGHDAYLYLLVEHQSTADELMAFRMLKYTCSIMDQYLKTTQSKRLPLIYPMVIYHAERKYPYSTDIRDLVDAPNQLIEQYFLKPFHLVDLGRIDDEELKQHTWAGIMELALKHIFARDILPYLEDMVEIMHRIDQAGGRNYISIVIQYLFERGELSDGEIFYQLISQKISPEVGDKAMNTLAKKFFTEGLDKGKEVGMKEGISKQNLEIARRLLAENVEPAFIAKITWLPLAEILNLNR